MTSPSSRTLSHLRLSGWTCAIVEHWNHYARIRQDLFGIFDIIAIHPERKGVLGIQCCAGASHAARLAKVQASPILPIWIATGNHAEVWSWSKQGPRGKRKVWTLRTTPAATLNP